MLNIVLRMLIFGFYEDMKDHDPEAVVNAIIGTYHHVVEDDLANDSSTSGSCSDIDSDDSVWYWRVREDYIARGSDIEDKELWTGEEYETIRRMLRKNNCRDYA